MRSSLLTVAAAVSSAAHIFQRQPTIQLVNARRSAVPLPAIPQLPRLLRPPRLSAGEADDEIAALEAKLAEAKRAKEEAERARLREEAEVRRAAAELSGDLDEGFDFNTLSSRKKVADPPLPPLSSLHPLSSPVPPRTRLPRRLTCLPPALTAALTAALNRCPRATH